MIKNKLASPRSTERHYSTVMIKELLREQFKVETIADIIRCKKGQKEVVDRRWQDLIFVLDS